MFWELARMVCYHDYWLHVDFDIWTPLAVMYHAQNIIKDDAVAIKLEPITHSSSVQHEYNILKHLEGSVGIPHALLFGRESTYHALVLDLLGPSLHSLFLSHSHKFSLDTVINLGDQLVSRCVGCMYRSLTPFPSSHVSNIFTCTVMFTATLNPRMLFWVLAIWGTPPSLLILVLQRNSGICQVSIYHFAKVNISLALLHLCQSTITWELNQVIVMISSHLCTC